MCPSRKSRGRLMRWKYTLTGVKIMLLWRNMETNTLMLRCKWTPGQHNGPRHSSYSLWPRKELGNRTRGTRRWSPPSGKTEQRKGVLETAKKVSLTPWFFRVHPLSSPVNIMLKAIIHNLERFFFLKVKKWIHKAKNMLRNSKLG